MEVATLLNVGVSLAVVAVVIAFRREQRREWGRARAAADEMRGRLDAVASGHQVTQRDVAHLERGVMTRLAAVGDAIGGLAAERRA